MLVLSRRLNESINIGDNIVVSIERLNSREVRIGIEAPKDVPVVRSELAERKDEK